MMPRKDPIVSALNQVLDELRNEAAEDVKEAINYSAMVAGVVEQENVIQAFLAGIMYEKRKAK